MTIKWLSHQGVSLSSQLHVANQQKKKKKKHFELGNYKNECVDLDTEENLSCKIMGTG